MSEESEHVMALANPPLQTGMASLRIAVIDDEAVLLELMQEMLSAMGHSTQVFSTAETALTELARSPCDLIFTDLRMRGMTGQEFYLRLKDIDATQAARIVFLTGDSADTETQRFLRDSGRHWLSKPFTYAMLTKCMKTVIPIRRHDMAA